MNSLEGVEVVRSMEITRKKKVMMLSVFLSVILLSFTVLQYIGFPRYSIEADNTLAQQQSLPREGRERTASDSLSADWDQVKSLTIQSCDGVEEPAEENVR